MDGDPGQLGRDGAGRARRWPGIVAALSAGRRTPGRCWPALLLPTIGLAAAPVNSLAAQRATLPPDLGERRRTEWGCATGTPSSAAKPRSAAWSPCSARSPPPWPCLLAPSPRHVQSPPLVVGQGGAHHGSGAVAEFPPTHPDPGPHCHVHPRLDPRRARRHRRRRARRVRHRRRRPRTPPTPRRRRARRIPRRRAHRPHRRETGRPAWADDARPQAGRQATPLRRARPARPSPNGGRPLCGLPEGMRDLGDGTAVMTTEIAAAPKTWSSFPCGCT